MRNIYFYCFVVVLFLWFPSIICGETGDLPKKTNKLGMEFIQIPPGTFSMGSPENEKYRDTDEVLHEVTISSSFYLQTTEVTQSQWEKVMNNNPSGALSCGGNCPVERISWQDCQKFITKLSKKGFGKYRLPTEAEWEYACRAGRKTPYSFGLDIECSKAMFENNTKKNADKCISYAKKHKFNTDSPVPVKSYRPNPWGLYDMHGNVWEWCRDWYGPYEAGPLVDPSGSKKGHMRTRRGGSFFKYGWYCRSANRNRGHPHSRFHTQGVRLVWEIE